MAKAPTTDRIAKLKARLNALEQKEKKDARKLDTRRKIIVGGAVLAALEKDSAWASSVRSLLSASVGRQKDREAIADLLGEAPKATANAHGSAAPAAAAGFYPSSKA